MSGKTYREQFEEALACSSKEQATQWLDAEIRRYKQRWGKEPDEARKIILENLGYMAGYYDREVARKIYELFGAAHPVFGTAVMDGTLTSDAAMLAGVRLALGIPR